MLLAASPAHPSLGPPPSTPTPTPKAEDRVTEDKAVADPPLLRLEVRRAAQGRRDGRGFGVFFGGWGGGGAD